MSWARTSNFTLMPNKTVCSPAVGRRKRALPFCIPPRVRNLFRVVSQKVLTLQLVNSWGGGRTRPIGLHAHQSALRPVRIGPQAYFNVLHHAGLPVGLTQYSSALQGRKERIVVPAQHEESLGLLHVPDQLVVVAVVAVVDIAGALAQLALPHYPLGGVGLGDREFDGDLSPDGEFQVELACRSEEHTSELQSLRHLVC